MLSFQPTGSTVVNIQNSAGMTGTDDGADGVTLSPTPLFFSRTSWNTPQRVTVTSAEDDIVHGTRRWTRTLVANGGGATAESGIEVSGTVTDNDTPAIRDTLTIVVSPTGSIEVPEGESSEFTAMLNVQPSGNVTVTVQNPGAADGVSLSPLSFTQTNWDTSQTVVVTSAEDDLISGTRRIGHGHLSRPAEGRLRKRWLMSPGLSPTTTSSA